MNLDPMERAMLAIAAGLTVVGALVVVNVDDGEPARPGTTVVREFEDGSIVLSDGREACLTGAPCDGGR